MFNHFKLQRCCSYLALFTADHQHKSNLQSPVQQYRN